MEKTLYKIICANREERKKNKRKTKTQMNYIRVFLNFKSEIELKEEEKDLINTVIDIYTVHMNMAQNEKEAAEQFFTEKLIQNKYYQIAKTVTEKEKNYFIIKGQHID